MRPPIPRFVRWTVVFAVLAAVAISVFQHWDARPIRQVASGTSQDGWTQTAWGPLGPTDRIMLEKVRQAGLWELPMGQLVQQQASSRRVREVGGLLSAEHDELAAQVSATAEKLGVSLPSQPSEQQQNWMTEISGKSGPDLDRAFVQRLRAAHGQVLPLLAQVQTGTRNDLIRSLATTASLSVTRHQQYLEGTRLVDSSALSELPLAGNSTRLAESNPTAAAAAVYTVALVYITVLLAAGALLWLLFTAARRAQPVPTNHPQPVPTPRSLSTSRPPRRPLHPTGAPPAPPRHAAHR